MNSIVLNIQVYYEYDLLTPETSAKSNAAAASDSTAEETFHIIDRIVKGYDPCASLEDRTRADALCKENRDLIAELVPQWGVSDDMEKRRKALVIVGWMQLSVFTGGASEQFLGDPAAAETNLTSASALASASVFL